MTLCCSGGSHRQGSDHPPTFERPSHASENPTVALRNGEIRPQILLTNLIFSLFTALLSGIRTHEQDVHDAKTELSGYLERLNSIPKETAELQSKYPGVIGSNLVSQLSSQAVVVAGQAFDVIKRFPAHVTPLECNSVASELITLQDYDRAMKAVETGLQAGPTPAERAQLNENGAQIKFLTKRPDEGRTLYSSAIADIKNNPDLPDYSKSWLAAWAEYSWGYSELSIGQFQNASVQFEAACKLALMIPTPLSVNDSMILKFVVALRAWAVQRFASHDVANGRLFFESAVLDEVPGAPIDPILVRSTNVVTELAWANTEFTSGNIKEARAHLDRARALTPGLIAVSNSDKIQQELKRLTDAIEHK